MKSFVQEYRVPIGDLGVQYRSKSQVLSTQVIDVQSHINTQRLTYIYVAGCSNQLRRLLRSLPDEEVLDTWCLSRPKPRFPIMRLPLLLWSCRRLRKQQQLFSVQGLSSSWQRFYSDPSISRGRPAQPEPETHNVACGSGGSITVEYVLEFLLYRLLLFPDDV